MASLLSIAALVTAAQALALDKTHPQPTQASKPNPTFLFPKITLPPSIQELARRQDGGGQTVLIGPDNTCGYFDGRPGAVYSCNGPDVTCALVTTSTFGAVACCDGDGCGLRAACIDYTDFVYSSACDDGCIRDTYTVKCTRTAAPYCGTVTFFNGIVDYYCDTLSDSTPQQLYTTWHGETDGRTFTPVVITLDDSVATSPFPSATQSSSDDDNDNDSRTSSAGSAGATSPADSEDGSSSNSNSNSSKSSTNVGAIAGGVVGGVAGLALIGLGIFFLIRHNNKKKRNISAQPPAAQMQQGPGPGMPPTQPVAGGAGYQQPYNPHYSQQYSPPPPGYPQQPYYGDQNKPAGFAAVAPAQLPDRNDSTSPANSQFTDNRQSLQPTSPTSTINSGWQPNQPYPGQQPSPVPNVPPTVHEAGGNVVGERTYNDNHHGQLHELGN